MVLAALQTEQMLVNYRTKKLRNERAMGASDLMEGIEGLHVEDGANLGKLQIFQRMHAFTFSRWHFKGRY